MQITKTFGVRRQDLLYICMTAWLWRGYIFDHIVKVSVQEWLKKGVYLFSEVGISFYTSCGLIPPLSGNSTSVNTSPLCSLPPPFSLLTLAHQKNREHPLFQVSLRGNLGIIVVLIYPEKPANPIFHLDVPEPVPRNCCATEAQQHPDYAALTSHSHTQLYWNCLTLRFSGGLWLALCAKLRVDLICFHVDNMLTHGITSAQQAIVVVLC